MFKSKFLRYPNTENGSIFSSLDFYANENSIEEYIWYEKDKTLNSKKTIWQRFKKKIINFKKGNKNK